jgi:hypothetical protein
MMKRFAIVLCALSCIYVFSSAAVDAAQWSKVYGSTGDESGAIWPIDTGGYYLSGSTTSYAGGRNALFAKLNVPGTVSWAKKIGGSAEDLLSVVNVSGGGFLVTGMTKSFGTAPTKYNIVWAKFNGDATWTPVYQKVFGGAGDEIGGFELTSDGGLLFCGTSDSYAANDDDILILKINSVGSVVWTKVLHKGPTDSASQAIELSDGYVVSGRIPVAPPSPLPGILVMKLNKSTGAPIWTKLYTLPLTTGTLTGGSLHPLADGSFILSGTMTPLGSTVGKTILVKISSAGAIQWQKSYGCASASVMASNVIENSDGTLIVSGTLMVPSTYNASILVMKLTASGALTLKRRLGATTEYNMGVVMKSDTGELLLSGAHGTSLTDAHKKVLYGKLNAATFVPLWAKTFGGTGMDIGGFVARSGAYMLEGMTTSFGQGLPKMNIFGMTLDANGNYPNCHVSPYNLSATIPSVTAASLILTATTPTLTARTAGVAANISLTVSSVSLPATNICAPITSADEPPLTEEAETPGEQPEGE